MANLGFDLFGPPLTPYITVKEVTSGKYSVLSSASAKRRMLGLCLSDCLVSYGTVVKFVHVILAIVGGTTKSMTRLFSSPMRRPMYPLRG